MTDGGAVALIRWTDGLGSFRNSQDKDAQRSPTPQPLASVRSTELSRSQLMFRMAGLPKFRQAVRSIQARFPFAVLAIRRSR